MKNSRIKKVHWYNGMSLTEGAFKANDTFHVMLTQAYGNAFLNDYNFGLFEVKNETPKENVLPVQIKDGAFLTIDEFKGITRSGNLILQDKLIERIKIDDINQAESDSSDIDLGVCVKSGLIPTDEKSFEIERDKVEGIDIEFISNEYSVFEISKWNRNEYLLLGKIKKKGGKYEITSGFIPPCTKLILKSGDENKTIPSYYNNFEKELKRVISYNQGFAHEATTRAKDDFYFKQVILNLLSIEFYRTKHILTHPDDFGIKYVFDLLTSISRICYEQFSAIPTDKIHRDSRPKIKAFIDEAKKIFERFLGETYSHTNVRAAIDSIERLLNELGKYDGFLNKLTYEEVVTN